METVCNYFKMLFGGVCAVFTFVFGGIDAVFLVLLSLMTVDYVTGVLVAVNTKTLSSRVGFRGILKKVGILCVVALSHLLGEIVNIPDVRSFVIGFYIANEGISILENAGLLGVPLPERLIDVLRQLEEKK